MISMPELLGLLAPAAGVAYWANAMRARELARRVGEQACRQHGVQLLDDTVALRRIRWRRDERGRLVFERWYRFEYAVDGFIRHDGSVTLMGGRVLNVDLHVGAELTPPDD